MRMIGPTISKEKLRVAAAYLMYFFSLQLVYTIWVVEIFAYEGYRDDSSLEKILLSLLIICGSASFLRPNFNPSTVFTNCALALVLIPSLVLYSGSNLDNYFLFVTSTAFLLIVASSRYLAVSSFTFPSISQTRLLWLLVIFSGMVALGIISFGGAKYLNFDLSSVYEFRRDAADSIPGIFGYLNSNATKVAIPFALVLALEKKKPFFVLSLIALSIFFFALTSNKSPLFYPAVVLFVYAIAGTQVGMRYFATALWVIVLIGGLDFWYAKDSASPWAGWFGALLVDRAILVPSLLNQLHIDFFLWADKYYWAYSKWSLGLVSAPYDLNIPFMIGREYFGKDEMSANTGWIGSGYANAGYAGVAFYSVLIGSFFGFLDRYAEKIGTRVVVSVFFLPVLSLLTSADLADMFLTNGLLLAVLLLLVMRPLSRPIV